MASCKGYRVSGKPKKAKKNIVFTDFSKIETRLKALYVRLKGIPEGGLNPCKQRVSGGGKYIKITTHPIFSMVQLSISRGLPLGHLSIAIPKT